MTFIPTHAQQLVIIQWMDSCIPKEEEEDQPKKKQLKNDVSHQYNLCK
jgi:hypothetical protein